MLIEENEMSMRSEKSPRVEDLISTEDDTMGSSISLSIGENSIRVKEKPKPVKEAEMPNEAKDKWWLKKPDTHLEVGNAKVAEIKLKLTPTPSPDVSSSMKEFLEKEKMCKAMHKREIEVKDKDDTLCDILASVAFEKYPSDFESKHTCHLMREFIWTQKPLLQTDEHFNTVDATDDDIGSFLEEMSKIAGALSPNSAPDRTKSGNSSKNHTEGERSVEELLEEAEKLVLKNSSSLSKSTSKSDTLVPENVIDDKESTNRARQMEAEIFQLIEEEVHKESEKLKKSPKNERKREDSPGFEILYDNVNALRLPKTVELQRKKFEEQMVEISSSSDVDDPIERHSKSEDLKSKKKFDVKKDNLRKEIIDVDKNFFKDLLKKSKDMEEGGMSGSSSFGQEDFSHFLKLLQGQTEKSEQDATTGNPPYNFVMPAATGEGNDKAGGQSIKEQTPEYPEKEITEILEKELPHDAHDRKLKRSMSEIADPDREANKEQCEENDVSSKPDTSPSAKSHSSKEKSRLFKLHEKDQISPRHADGTSESKKVVNSKGELYNVGLTPRIELFADAIPKLLAEKSVESEEKEDRELANKTEKRNLEPQVTVTAKTTFPDPSKSDRVVSAPDTKQKKEIRFCKSRSYDQICKPPRSSAENVRLSKPFEVSRKPIISSLKKSPASKPKLPPKPAAKVVLKPKTAPKLNKDPIKRSTTSLASSTKTTSIRSPDVATSSMGGGDTKHNLSKQDWEVLCREERHKNVLLKEQLDSEAKLYKMQIENMRTSFEEELFALKKQNIILKAKVDELSLSEKRREVPKVDNKVLLMEREMEKQEGLICAYEVENKKLLQETKRMQEEMKSLQKQKSSVVEVNDTQRLADRVKDLEEETLKLNLEVQDLRTKNADCALKNDDLIQQNGLLTDELEMFREQLRTKSDYITDRLQAMTASELELKKQVEDLTVKLSSKTEQLRTVKLEFDRVQQNVLPMEKELLELRVKASTFQEKLQTSKCHIEREKQLSQKLKDQVIVDNKKIMDLNRQVREMERILKRKNPDSVSALILTANSEHEKIGAEKIKLLEDRILCLESDIKQRDDIAQKKVLEFQNKFTEMKDKYEAQIAELENKLLEATERERKVYNDMFTQTVSKHVENKSIETAKRDERVPSIEKEDKKDQKNKVGPKSQNIKEDAHLIATIRGLKLELNNKDKTVSKLTKEYQELQKTNRRLQKEREKLLNDRRSFKCVDLERRGLESRVNLKMEGNDQNSNVYQNGHSNDSHQQRLTTSGQKLYDPLQYTESAESVLIKRLADENDILKEELGKINKDFMALKNKRLHDLNLLQEEHEREMASLVKEYSVKFGDSKVVKLQGQINTQVAVITHLKQQIEKLRDYKEQVVVLKAEREHLEHKVNALNEKVKYLSTPGTEQLQLLQDKITILQQRHESREMTLQTLVRDLLRNRNQCKDCKNEKGKSKQLCYFRQELDHILGMLQEIANVH